MVLLPPNLLTLGWTLVAVALPLRRTAHAFKAQDWKSKECIACEVYWVACIGLWLLIGPLAFLFSALQQLTKAILCQEVKLAMVLVLVHPQLDVLGFLLDFCYVVWYYGTASKAEREKLRARCYAKADPEGNVLAEPSQTHGVRNDEFDSCSLLGKDREGQHSKCMKLYLAEPLDDKVEHKLGLDDSSQAVETYVLSPASSTTSQAQRWNRDSLGYESLDLCKDLPEPESETPQPSPLQRYRFDACDEPLSPEKIKNNSVPSRLSDVHNNLTCNKKSEVNLGALSYPCSPISAIEAESPRLDLTLGHRKCVHVVSDSMDSTQSPSQSSCGDIVKCRHAPNVDEPLDCMTDSPEPVSLVNSGHALEDTISREESLRRRAHAAQFAAELCREELTALRNMEPPHDVGQISYLGQRTIDSFVGALVPLENDSRDGQWWSQGAELVLELPSVRDDEGNDEQTMHALAQSSCNGMSHDLRSYDEDDDLVIHRESNSRDISPSRDASSSNVGTLRSTDACNDEQANMRSLQGSADKTLLNLRCHDDFDLMVDRDVSNRDVSPPRDNSIEHPDTRSIEQINHRSTQRSADYTSCNVRCLDGEYDSAALRDEKSQNAPMDDCGENCHACKDARMSHYSSQLSGECNSRDLEGRDDASPAKHCSPTDSDDCHAQSSDDMDRTLKIQSIQHGAGSCRRSSSSVASFGTSIGFGLEDVLSDMSDGGDIAPKVSSEDALQRAQRLNAGKTLLEIEKIKAAREARRANFQGRQQKSQVAGQSIAGAQGEQSDISRMPSPPEHSHASRLSRECNRRPRLRSDIPKISSTPDFSEASHPPREAIHRPQRPNGNKTCSRIDEIKAAREARRADAEAKRRQKMQLVEQGVDPDQVHFAALLQEWRWQNPDISSVVQPRSRLCDSRIKVCVRKRPVNVKERTSGAMDLVSMGIDGQVIMHELGRRVDKSLMLQHWPFSFDGAYDEFVTNEELFSSTAHELVDAVVLEEASATMFAYGQTGSGKTFSMAGAAGLKSLQVEAELELGMYQLSAIRLFELLEEQLDDAPIPTVSFIEIYGTKVRDLLEGRKEVKMLEDSRGRMRIFGARETRVTSASQLCTLIAKGSELRACKKMTQNNESSRSHAVLTVQLYSRDSARECGRFSLIDLAGNERGADNQAANALARQESADINRSLLALKECIRSLARERPEDHTPFRQSKITTLLRESFLSPNARVCVLNCISPASSSSEYTLNTLRYAAMLKDT
mmetsp:Transcript_105591/g.164599  ORF Transcript_105591/g.164599 Transcript_105591/m.164599 type:complete len:1245 (-) Transcript_105591:387-4121(-)